MNKASFSIYIDESGDEGFVFNPDGSGSSKWMVLSGVVVRQKNDLITVQTLKDSRKALGKNVHQSLHFRNLKHEQRIPYIRTISKGPYRFVAILVCKPFLHDHEKFETQKYLLYRYATRYLLERISWLCRDHRPKSEKDLPARIIFSNRSSMSYENLKSYLRLLKDKSDPLDVRIDWSVIDPEKVSATDHSRLAGLQIADAVASSIFYAVNINRYGETEDRYLKILSPLFYRHENKTLSYGIKFMPDDFDKIKSANPHLAVFADIDSLEDRSPVQGSHP